MFCEKKAALILEWLQLVTQIKTDTFLPMSFIRVNVQPDKNTSCEYKDFKSIRSSFFSSLHGVADQRHVDGSQILIIRIKAAFMMKGEAGEEEVSSLLCCLQLDLHCCSGVRWGDVGLCCI